MTQSAQKCPKCVKTGVKWPKWGSTPISREPRLLETGLTPHFSQKHHVSISVLHISYLSDDWKCSKMPIKGKKGPKDVKIGQILYLTNLWS